MTIEEAIRHANENSLGTGECAAEHRQLADWLERLRLLEAMAAEGALEDAADLKVEVLQLRAENRRLAREARAAAFRAGAARDDLQAHQSALKAWRSVSNDERKTRDRIVRGLNVRHAAERRELSRQAAKSLRQVQGLHDRIDELQKELGAVTAARHAAAVLARDIGHGLRGLRAAAVALCGLCRTLAEEGRVRFDDDAPVFFGMVEEVEGWIENMGAIPEPEGDDA